MAEEKRDDRRSFLGPDGVITYYITPPNAEDIRGADWHYSKMYTRSLVEGITTSAEMMDILRQRGIIGPEFEQRATELQKELGEKLDLLYKATDLEIKRNLSLEVYNAREELFQWNQRLSGPMNNTCEQISDDARLEYLTSCMIQTEDGKKVWDSYDSFSKEKNTDLAALAVRSRLEVMLYLQGLESDFLDKTPEAMAMREVEEDIIKRAEEALKAADAIIQEEKEIVEADKKAEAKAKPKTTKNKKITKTKKNTDN